MCSPNTVTATKTSPVLGLCHFSPLFLPGPILLHTGADHHMGTHCCVIPQMRPDSVVQFSCLYLPFSVWRAPPQLDWKLLRERVTSFAFESFIALVPTGVLQYAHFFLFFQYWGSNPWSSNLPPQPLFSIWRQGLSCLGGLNLAALLPQPAEQLRLQVCATLSAFLWFVWVGFM